MSEPTLAQRHLAERLAELRTQASITQAQIAAVLGASTPLVSSWENAKAIPPEDRLRGYALAFAAPHSFSSGELPDEADLNDDEEALRRRLIDELIALRDDAIRAPGDAGEQAGALGGRFWYFPDGASIRVITTPTFQRLRGQIPYANPWHPNYIQSFEDMDRDATIELVSHIRAENPTADVRFMTADKATHNDLTKHVVVLGQADGTTESQVMGYLMSRLELPVRARVPIGGDLEFDGEFVVTKDAKGRPAWFRPDQKASSLVIHRPRFVRKDQKREVVDGLPVLEYDVALLARRPNQLNLSTSVTLCSGVFSRGTFGAVRALTDVSLRARNERFLVDRFGSLTDFWLLFYVPVFPSNNGLETVTPDLRRPFHRLADSTGADTDADQV